MEGTSAGVTRIRHMDLAAGARDSASAAPRASRPAVPFSKSLELNEASAKVRVHMCTLTLYALSPPFIHSRARVD